jgi:hypothetical protein
MFEIQHHHHVHFPVDPGLEAKVNLIIKLLKSQGDTMGLKLDKIAEGVTGVAANTEEAKKSFAEIRKLVDELIAKNADVDAAFAAGKAAQEADDQVAVDAAATTLETARADQALVMQQLDDVVPDVPVPTPGL